MRKTIVLLVFSLILLTLTSCNTTQINSVHKDRSIAIDGNYIDWQNAMLFIEEDNIGLGIMNSQDSLYLCLTTSDPQRQIIRNGLTLWLDAGGGKKKTVGIHYPIGLMNSGIPMDRLAPGGVDPTGIEAAQRDAMIDNLMTELEILGPGKKDKQLISAYEADILMASLNASNNTLVYELRIPFKSSGGAFPSLGITAGSLIGFGFETGEMDRETMQDSRQSSMGAGPPGGGRRGGRGGGGRGGGGMGGRPDGDGGGMGGGRPEGMERLSTLKGWVRIQLAADSSHHEI